MNKIHLPDYLKKYQDTSFLYRPNPGNIGDGLLAYAAYSLFDDLNLNYKIVKMNDQISPDEIVVYGGGGNLIEGLYTESINFIMRHIDSCREMLVLPHTIYGFKNFFSRRYPNLKVICREPQSYYGLLRNNFPEENLFIDHDLSFYFKDKNIIALSNYDKGEGELYCFRNDNEKISINYPPSNIDVSLAWNGEFWHNKELAHYSTLSVASFLQEHEAIHTNRLHIAILGALINKKVFLYPNIYYKNKEVYYYSIIKHFSNVYFLDYDYFSS